MKSKWFIYKRRTIPIQRLDCPMRAVSEMGYKYNAPDFQHVLYAHQYGKMWWSWNDKEIKENGKRVLDIIKTNGEIKKHFELLKKVAERAIKAADNVKKMELGRLDANKLISVFNKLIEECFPAHAFMNSDIDAVDIVPAESFNKKIIEEMPKNLDEKEKLRVVRDLTTPAYKTYVTQEEEALFQYIKKYGAKTDNKEIDKIAEKFWWTGLGWETLNITEKIKTRDYFIKEIKSFVGLQIDADKEPEKIKNALDEIIEKRNSHIKKFNLSNEIRSFIEIFDEYAYFHDLRKEMQMRVMYSFYLLSLESAKRLGMSEHDIEWLLNKEICNALEHGFVDEELKKEIEKRKTALTLIASKKGFEIYSGQEAIKKRDEEVKEEIKDADSFKGIVASPGLVKGVVKVCYGADEAIKKIQKGDILVTTMTMPEYAPAMKKAAAIITNEGGITCHAAIISRELGIPCIVGADIATDVLKDRDMVEVDAEHGIVRKIGNGIKLIIFDFSGVCTNSEEPDYMKIFAKEHNLDLKEAYDNTYIKLIYKAEVGEMSGTDVWKEILRKYNIDEEADEQIKKMMKLKKADEGVFSLISRLRKKYKIAYLSNYCKEYWDYIARDFELDKYFDFGLVSYQIKARKPSDEGFLKILEHFNVKPSETIFIDDSEKNLVSAGRLGIKTIHFKNSKDLVKDFKKLGVDI